MMRSYTIGSRIYRLDDSFQPVAVMSWTYLNGPCDGADMVSRWPQIIRIDGVVINDWRMRPWTAKPIVIRSFALTKLTGGPHTNAMVGNNYIMDAMVGFGSNETSAWAGTPSGTGVPFPGTEDDPGDAYFDLHVACNGGGPAAFRVDVAYSPTPDEAPQPPPPSIWFKELTLNDSAGGITHSQIIAAADITGSGGSIKITFRAGAAPLVLNSATIAPRQGSTSNPVGSPVPILFGGQSSKTIPAGTEFTSDALAFPFDNSTDYLVTMAHGSSSGVKYASSGAGVYYKIGSGSYAFGPSVTFGVTRIEAL